MTENSTKITKKPATSVKENSSVKGSSKNKKRKNKDVLFIFPQFEERKNATISALSAALRQRLS